MLSKIRKLKNESGQAMIVFAMAIVVLCGFAAFTIDVGSVSASERQLQGIADSAALAGAQELPNASAAASAAVHYAVLNGMDASDVTVTTPYNGDSTKIEVVCNNTVNYTFARILGYTDTDVSSRAVAQATSGGGVSGGPFDYAVFSGSTSKTLTFNGSSTYVEGNVHSNYKLKMTGSSQIVTGAAEAVSSFTSHGSSINIGTCQAAIITLTGSGINIGKYIYSAAPVIDMPDFSSLIRDAAEVSGQTYSGNKTFNRSSISVNSPIYVDGDLTINGSSFTGCGIILASGDITFDGSNLKNSSTDSVCFYSINGDITINGSSAELEGLVYAPNGKITMNGSSQIIYGRVVAEEIDFNGSNDRIIAGGNDLDCLPQSSIKLVE